MADHLILSLQARPFFIFPCSFHRPWRFTGRIKFSDPQFRLSSQLQLVNSTSPSQSSSSSSSPFPPSNSAPEKFDLVSCTQLKDGSHVFRFGDASEIEEYLEAEEKARCVEVEKKQHAKIAEEAKDLDRLSELKEKSDAKKKSVNSSIETGSEKDERAAPSNLSNVIKIKDRKRPRAPTKKKKETSTSVDVSRSEDKVETKIASVSNPSSIVSVADAIPTSSTEEEVVVSEKSEPVNENEITVELYNVEPLSSKVMEKVSVNKIGSRETNGYQQSTENRMEVQERLTSSTSQHGSQSHDLEEVAPVSTIEIDDNLDVREKPEKTIEAEENRMEVQARPRSSTSQNGSQSHDIEEVAPVSTIEIDDNFDVREKPVKPIEAEENLVVEPIATAAVSPDELISTSEATHHSVDEIAEKPVADTSEENPMKTFEAEENILVEPKATHRSVDVITEKPVADTSEESPMETFEAEENILVKPEATHRSVDEITEKPVTDTSEVGNERENAASTIEDETTLRDTKTDNGSISKSVNDTKGEDFQLPAPETAVLESIEVASGREELVSKAFYLESGFASFQNPSKALAGREDAYFIHHHNWIGIADGVSQWSFEGINKGMYSQELMSNCQKITSDETAKITDPVEVLHRSVNETKSSGSSTALIAHLDNNELHIANIGDSGFIVIRDGTVLQKSSPMFHHFCFPLQIKQGDDVLKLAEVYHVNLEEGDVVITATDGLFDNLYEKEIVSIVCRSLEQSLEPQKIAELVAAKAQEVGGSGRERTPFADAAKEEGYNGYRGGKLDAVTVIVSFVKTVST